MNCSTPLRTIFRFLAQFLQGRNIQLDVEVAAVADDGAVFHLGEVLAANDFEIAGDRDEEISDRGGLFHRHDAEAVHDRFDGLQWIDLGHDDVGAHALGAHGDAASAPAVPSDDEDGAADQPVGRADDAVHGGLAGAVAVVEHVLGVGIVDGDDRELEHFLLGHAAQPNDAGGGFFRAADHVAQANLSAWNGDATRHRRRRPS